MKKKQLKSEKFRVNEKEKKEKKKNLQENEIRYINWLTKEKNIHEKKLAHQLKSLNKWMKKNRIK